MAYIIHVQPFKKRRANLQEIFNEYCNLIASYCQCLFLNVSLSTNQQNIVGWIFMGIIMFVMFANFAKVLISTLFKKIPEAYHKYVPREEVKEFK